MHFMTSCRAGARLHCQCQNLCTCAALQIYLSMLELGRLSMDPPCPRLSICEEAGSPWENSLGQPSTALPSRHCTAEANAGQVSASKSTTGGFSTQQCKLLMPQGRLSFSFSEAKDQACIADLLSCTVDVLLLLKERRISIGLVHDYHPQTTAAMQQQLQFLRRAEVVQHHHCHWRPLMSRFS